MESYFAQPHPPALASLQTALAGVQAAMNHLRRPPKGQPQEQLQFLLSEVYTHLEELQRYLHPGQTLGEAQWLELHLLGHPAVRMGKAVLELRPRFVELLCVLALHPEGLTSEQLTLAVWGEAGETGCAKTELHRLRQWVPLSSRPYRIQVSVAADFLEVIEMLRRGCLRQALGLYKGPLLPRSQAPEIVETRVWLEESLREAVLCSGEGELVWALAERLGTDLELWELALELLPDQDSRHPLASVQVNRLKTHW